MGGTKDMAVAMMRYDPCFKAFLGLAGAGLFGLTALVCLITRGPFWFIVNGAIAVACAVAYATIRPGGQMSSALKASPENPDCSRGKFAIVTGGNTGVGKATAQQLALWGLKVVIGCRDVSKGEMAVEEIKAACPKLKGTLEVMQLDLSDMESVSKFAKKINEKDVKINLLVNNAGVMSIPNFTPIKSVHGLEIQFVTNHVGHFLLTRLLMKKVAACGGRVINLASLGHMGAPPFNKEYYFTMNDANYDANDAYFMSKQANVRFARELNRRFDAMASQYPRVKPATSYSVHPGGVATELGRHIWSSASTQLAHMTFKTPEQGAQTSLFLCAAARKDVRPGAYYADCKVSPIADVGDDKHDDQMFLHFSFSCCSVAKSARGFGLDKLLWTWTEELLQAHLV